MVFRTQTHTTHLTASPEPNFETPFSQFLLLPFMSTSWLFNTNPNVLFKTTVDEDEDLQDSVYIPVDVFWSQTINPLHVLYIVPFGGHLWLVYCQGVGIGCMYMLYSLHTCQMSHWHVYLNYYISLRMCMCVDMYVYKDILLLCGQACHALLHPPWYRLMVCVLLGNHR